ncbi:hypothetical protein [Streptomyces sp. 135]|uniref:hypothetical protein n=1 Tax=Streptomyces sp. 135 TaxID=2838850 RepID=UPI001CC104A7|nr:hypothetical protein [Streptomyces sp. 135]
MGAMGDPEDEAELPLSDLDIEAYRAVAAGEPVDDARLTRLTALGLVDRNPYESGGHIALDPRTAAQRLLAAERAVMSRAIDRMARIPALESLVTHFDPNRMYGGPGSEFLPSKSLMNPRIGQA